MSSQVVPEPGSDDTHVNGGSEAPVDGPEPEDRDAQASNRNLIEWVVVLLGALLLAVLLRIFVLQAFWIESESMESTLLVDERVLVDKVSYRFGDIDQGDIVVFSRIEAEIAIDPTEPEDVIKRVIAVGGQTVESRDGTVYVDGQALDEPYLDDDVVTGDFGPEVVPDGQLFVMGDNREASVDSRAALGTIDVDRVVGRAFFLFWPLGGMGTL